MAMPVKFRRRAFGPDEAIVPEIPYNGWSSQRAARPALSAHHHDAFEFCLVNRGTVEWWARDRVYDVGRGNVYITYPGEEHGAVGSVLHPCELYWLHVRLGGAALPGLTKKATVRLQQGLRELPTRTFEISRPTRDAFMRIHREHCEPRPHAVAVVRGALLSLLTGVIRDYETWRQSGRRQVMSPAIAAIVQRLTRDPVTPCDMQQLADRAGLGVSQFQTRFRREVGLPIGQYRAKVRNHLARRMLRDTDRPITEAALQLGFASSQHFATQFRQMNGLSPRQYRQMMRPPPLASRSDRT